MGLVKPKTIQLVFAKHSALRCKNKFRMALNQDNVSAWNDMPTREMLFQWEGSIKIQLSVLVWYKADIIIVSLNVACSRPDIPDKIAHLALNNNYILIHNWRIVWQWEIILLPIVYNYRNAWIIWAVILLIYYSNFLFIIWYHMSNVENETRVMQSRYGIH